MIGVAAVLLLLTRRIKLPSIAVYLGAGLLLGPMTGLVQSGDATGLISELGIVLMLFLVGMELSVDQVRGFGKTALCAGVVQVGLTVAAGFALCLGLKFSPMESLFLALGLAVSSTVVVIKMLQDSRQLDTAFGRIAVGVLLLQDLVVVLALTLLDGLASSTQGGRADLVLAVVKAFVGMTILLAGTLGASHWLLPRPMAWAARSPDTLFIWSLAWCLVVVAAAHGMHLSIEVGAFLAGLSLARLPYSFDMRRRIRPLMDFFVAIFFIALGLGIRPGELLGHAWQIGAMSLFALLFKPLVVFGTLLLMRHAALTAFLASVPICQVSEFSVLFAAMGVRAGLIDTQILSDTTGAALITILVSTYLILFQDGMFRRLNRTGVFRHIPSGGRGGAAPVNSVRRGHMIVVGMNSLGRSLVQRLHERGEVVVAVDTDPAKLDGLPCEKVLGDVSYASLLEEIGLPTARLLISALQIEDTNDFLAYFCKSHGVPCAIHAVDMHGVDGLLEMDVAYLIFPKVDGIKAQTRELHRLGLLTP